MPAVGEFVFVDTAEFHDSDVRKAVRSRAAQYSHRNGDRRPKDCYKIVKQKAKSDRDLTPSTGDSNRTASDQDEVAVSTTNRRDSSGESQTTPTDLCLLPNQRRSQVRSRSWAILSTPSPLSQLSKHTKGDPFETYPVPAQPWYPKALDYMWTFMLRGLTAIQPLQTECATTLLWVQRLTLSEPCYFYMNMLTVTHELVSQGQLDAGLVFWLTSQCVAALNQALSSPDSALGIGVILAVGRLALREIMIGDREVGQRIHRPAQVKMIAMAGGLEVLPIPPLLRRHLLYVLFNQLARKPD